MLSSTPHTDQLRRVNDFISSLEANDLFLPLVDDNKNLMGEIRSSEFHQRLSSLSSLQDVIIRAGMDEMDYFGLMAEIRAYQFCIRLETLKVTFSSMLDIKKLATPDELKKSDFQLDDLTLGTLIRRINEVIYPLNGVEGLEKQQRKQMRDKNQELFFRTFRNSIIHRDFELIGANLIYGDDKDPQTWNSVIAETMSSQLTTLEVLISQKLTSLYRTTSSFS